MSAHLVTSAGLPGRDAPDRVVSARHGRDRGSILPIALVLTLVLGSVSVALARYVATSLRTTKITDDRVDRLAAADSAMQTALTQLDARICAPITPVTIDGVALTSTCRAITRLENADGAYAVVATGEGLDPGVAALDTDAGAASANAEKVINGPIYLGVNTTVDIDNTAAILPGEEVDTWVGGEIRYDVDGDCPGSVTPPTAAADWNEPLPLVQCDSRGWALVSPQPTLPSVPSSALSVSAESTPSCTVYSPGTKTGGSLDVSTSTFFLPGTYYFVDVAITITGPALIGMIDGAPRVPAGCETQAAAHEGGAVWVFGGSSTLLVDKGDVDFYPLTLGTGATAHDVSLMAFTTATGGFAATTVDPNDTELVNRKNPTQSSLSFHGLVWAPGSWLNTGSSTTSGGARLEFLGGLTLARATLETAANVDGFNISVPVRLVKYHLIEVTAVRNGTTKVRTVSRHPSTGLQVLTWRVVG